MLIEQTTQKLAAMKLGGMARALEHWRENRGSGEQLEPDELVGLLADAEWIDRENRSLTTRRRSAKFPERACVEAVDYKHQRKLERKKMLELISCAWIAAHQNVIITGPTGIGKTYLPCALGDKACREGYRVIYTRVPRFLDELYQARVDGTLPRRLVAIAKTDLLILDDFGDGGPLNADQRRVLREILEDRYSVRSTIVTSQLKPNLWHAYIGDDTIADAICDRLVHNAHRLELGGESIRKKRGMNSVEDTTA
jgi:DNA replication protein DnaC